MSYERPWAYIQQQKKRIDAENDKRIEKRRTAMNFYLRANRLEEEMEEELINRMKRHVLDEFKDELKQQARDEFIQEEVEKRFYKKLRDLPRDIFEKELAKFFELFIPRYEKGVIKLFKIYRSSLGFGKIINERTGGCDAHIMKDGKELRIEFERYSQDFISHKHNPEKVDLVICWVKNKDLPIEVMELSKELPKIIPYKGLAEKMVRPTPENVRLPLPNSARWPNG